MINKVKELITPIVEQKDCYIDSIEYFKERNDLYLRIFCDLNQGRIDMDTVVELSELISEKLDEADLINQEYYLEVSSPGAEKELKTLQHVINAIGEYVFIKFKNPTAGLDEVYATLKDVHDETLEIEYLVKNIKKKMTVPYSHVSFIRLAIKF